MSVGTASHICAAAPGGPRYDEKMTLDERRSVTNGIWMCRNHGTAIDSPDSKFTTELLHAWKKDAETESRKRVLEGTARPVSEKFQDAGDLRVAAAADIEVFRRTARWPASSIELALTIEGVNESITTKSLARAVVSLDDLVLVAPPGMGKTTVLLQVAEGLLAEPTGIPMFVSLADWATEDMDLLASILRRPSFRGISEEIFRAAAAQPGVVLLLDGWNELDTSARRRARVQLLSLKAELPSLGIIISTRRQSLDVPIEALRVDLLPLNYSQQEEIAREMYGEPGVRIVDEAWRTPGIRELVSIPLYLTVLLSLPRGSAFPTTKEELLRRFVEAHEAVPEHAEALSAALAGLHDRYLCDLAVRSTSAFAVALSEVDARRSISETGRLLMAEGQVATLPQPHDALEALISNHVLLRLGDTPGYSFQHQQFQEWYASHMVQDRMRLASEDPAELKALQTQIFDTSAWEEAILFAVERLARSTDELHKAVCARSVLAALEVDPLLAAEMIYRSSDEIWALVADDVQRFVRAWHVPGTVDRALRFMLTSGRPEFLAVIWPLVTHEGEQNSLRALRNCRQLRRSIFGNDAASAIAELPEGPREVLLHEMASHGDVDGLDLATALAKMDPHADVQLSVVSALSFRRADYHIAEILRTASDATLDQIVRQRILDVDEVADSQCRERLAQAQQRSVEADTDYDKLQRIARAPYDETQESTLYRVLSTMDIRLGDRDVSSLAETLRTHYPFVVAKALIARVLEGRSLFHHAAEIVSAGRVVEDDDSLLKIAQEDLDQYSQRASIAAVVLGPRSSAVLLDMLFELEPRRKVNGAWDPEVNRLFRGLEGRLALAPAESILEAVQARSASASVSQMALMAEVLFRCRGEQSSHDRPFSDTVKGSISGLMEEWAYRMLASGEATRMQTASLVKLATCAPSGQLLPVLQALLDDNLRRLRAFREQAEAESWRPGNAVDEARTPHTHEYARAFRALKHPDTRHILYSYLDDSNFGEEATGVLVEHWLLTNEPPSVETRLFGRLDFSGVPARRAARIADPVETCEEADTIFAVIQSLLEGDRDDQHRLAVALGTRAVRLPHGKWSSVVKQLLGLALPRARCSLLVNLCLSGEILSLDEVTRGISDTLEEAKSHTWILSQSDGYELRQWLQLLPFTDRARVGLDLLTTLPESFQHPHMLEDVVFACGSLADEEGGCCLFRLAVLVPAFYGDHSWLRTIFRLATGALDIAHQLVDLAVQGAFEQKGLDHWFVAREIAGLLEAHADVRGRTYALLADGPATPGLVLLARAISEAPDMPGLLLLVRAEILTGRNFAGYRSVEHVATERVPSRDWSGAFEILPAPVAELRRDLLAMCTDGGPSDVPARYLREIDEIRDIHGLPEGEPRHPDFASGVSWPLLIAREPD
ncbi:hypothetical protein [Pseudomonas sp. P8_241]|uniref:NACHT domain-containing protein n=1 Tax=Pseudomonas sp. P8_241 TaxID=3043445 RepID=UPI002A35FFFE|nr:hypothetical protein [Pseudomonas sp. P8_241]WPN47500.1 hypothetical protein QMK58_02130 [Pseudomonas sp. P8_241]